MTVEVDARRDAWRRSQRVATPGNTVRADRVDPDTRRPPDDRKELPMSIVTILVIIVLILLAIYLFRRIA